MNLHNAGYFLCIGAKMWQKSKHSDFMHFWINTECQLCAGLSSGGEFVLWNEKGRHDTVQCTDINDALEVMQLVANTDKAKKNKEK